MTHHETHSNEGRYARRRASGVAWLALIIAIAALLLAVAAYNRSGDDIGERLNAAYEDIERNVRLEVARLNAAADLGRIEARREVDENYPEFEADVEAVRENLRNAYAEGKMEGSEGWRELDDAFDRLIANIRSGAENAGDSLREMMEALRRND